MTGVRPQTHRSEDETAIPLEARGLVFEVDAARLLDGVDLHARRAELIGVIGPNGAGKSTLLRAFQGVIRAQKGITLLEGHDLAGLSNRDIARVEAMVPQAPPEPFGFTAMETVLMGRYPHMGRFQVESARDRAIAATSMSMTETDAFAQRLVTTLSGGERQRVFVARALAQQPHVLLLDEPTSNLDVQHQLKIMDVVTQLVSQGVTAIAAVHDLGMAARYCDRLVLLNKGRVVAEGTPEQVLTSEHIEAAFGVRAVVFRDPFTGAPAVSLLDYSGTNRKIGVTVRVHVVCGGGTGARVMYELRRGGFDVTACVLGAGDADRSAADSLGIPYVPIQAFSTIDDATHEAHVSLAEKADYVVLCSVPIGVNNLRNLEAIMRAPRVVSIESSPVSGRDFTAGEAARLLTRLRPLARCGSGEEAVAFLYEQVNVKSQSPVAPKE